MKTIVTHLNPDLDALCSVWLLKRFLPGWTDAEVKFIPAGIVKIDSLKTEEGDEVLVVDTGFGELDHHQSDERTCGAKLVWKHIQKCTMPARPAGGYNVQCTKTETRAIERLLDVVLRIDYDAQDITMPGAADDFNIFLFNERQILRGYRTIYRGQSEKHLELGFTILDSVFEVLKAKIEAEDIIKKGLMFETKWGKGIGAETNNEMYMHLAQQLGFKVVVSKDPKRGHIRIHGLPRVGIDFTKAKQELEQRDPDATWYLHQSLSLLLNGSTANPDMKPTTLTLNEVVDVLRRK
ncbi:hypothetical protein HY345_04495 [Candidatus Microgenomates bacterium]|nr:hypothetical protein [Candidatus Microgenomates bacterium]